MKVIDIDKWKRKIPYQNFIKYTNPILSLSTRLDVTKLVKRCKRTGESFFTVFLYLVAKAINETEDMKIRILKDQVVIFEKVNVNYIVMQDNGVIAVSSTKFHDDFKTFYKNVRCDIENVKHNHLRSEFDVPGVGNDCVYITCLPWVDLVSITNPYDLKDKEQSSIPRISWGKFIEDGNGNYKMGFDISVHHALIDGEPVSAVMNKISEYLTNIDNLPIIE